MKEGALKQKQTVETYYEGRSTETETKQTEKHYFEGRRTEIKTTQA